MCGVLSVFWFGITLSMFVQYNIIVQHMGIENGENLMLKEKAIVIVMKSWVKKFIRKNYEAVQLHDMTIDYTYQVHFQN